MDIFISGETESIPPFTIIVSSFVDTSGIDTAAVGLCTLTAGLFVWDWDVGLGGGGTVITWGILASGGSGWKGLLLELASLSTFAEVGCMDCWQLVGVIWDGGSGAGVSRFADWRVLEPLEEMGAAGLGGLLMKSSGDIVVTSREASLPAAVMLVAGIPVDCFKQHGWKGRVVLCTAEFNNGCMLHCT